MKKWFLIFFLLLIMAISGCKWDSTLDIVTNSIAEDRISISKGEKDGVTCTLMCGYREEDYVLNGVSTSLIEFGVLTFSISGFTPFDYGEPTYVLNVGIDRFSGVLELNPYDSTLVADVEKVMNIDENVVAYLNLNGKTYEIHLNSISKQWQVSHSLALKTFVETYKKELKEHIFKGKIDGETYVKIIYDDEIDEYYWYVNFITPNGSSIMAVIDVDTAKILVEKVNIL